jgi:hypothetical protein
LASIEPTIQQDEEALQSVENQEDHERKEQALQRKKRNAYIRKIAKTDHHLASILDHASRPTGFDFARLSTEDMTYYFQYQIKQQLQPLLQDGIHHMLGLDEKNLTKYLCDIYDMDKKELTIATAE